MPIEISTEVEAILEKEGFKLLRGLSDLPAIGVNQVYRHSSGFLTIKFDVTGDFKPEELYSLNSGKLIHTKINEKFVGIYGERISDRFMLKLADTLGQIKPKTTTFNMLEILNPISTARAEENCGVTGSVFLDDGIQALKKISVATITDSLFECMDTMKGSIVDRFSVDLSKSPLATIREYYDGVSTAVSGFFDFTKGLSEALLNPSVGFQKLETMLGDAGPLFTSMLSSVALLPPSVAVHFACSLVSRIGINAILSAVSGGLGAANLLVTLKNMASSFDVLGRFKKLMDKLQIKRFEDLGFSTEGLKKLITKMANGTLDKKKLKTVEDALESESSLARSFAVQGLQCSL